MRPLASSSSPVSWSASSAASWRAASVSWRTASSASRSAASRLFAISRATAHKSPPSSASFSVIACGAGSRIGAAWLALRARHSFIASKWS
jgi:acyl-CoA synthetase (NDP forming)